LAPNPKLLSLLLAGLVLASPAQGGAAPMPGPPLGPKDIDKLPASAPTATVHYGAAPLQYGELRLPAGKGPFPVAVVIHGGCWTKGYATARNTAALASALTQAGVATWNIEYRQVGDAGGGWPGTYQDWAAATDHLRTLAKKHRLDLSRVVVVGHSAGAHAALWLAGRPRLPTSSEIRGARPLQLRAVVAIDGPADLLDALAIDAQICGRPVIVPLMGGSPAEQPTRFAHGSPAQLLPLGVPQYLVQSSVLRPEHAEAYRVRAEKLGDKVRVLSLPGRMHFNMIAPTDPTFTVVQGAVLEAVGQQ